MGKRHSWNYLLSTDIIKDSTLAHYAGYTEEDIQPVFKLMIDYLARPVVHEAFFKKYASKKFLKGRLLLYHICVSLI